MPVMQNFSMLPAPDNSCQFFPVYYIGSFTVPALYPNLDLKTAFMPTPFVSSGFTIAYDIHI